MVDDAILLDIIKRIEEMEKKLADPKLNEPTGNCFDMMTRLAMGMKQLTEDDALIIERWFWAVTNSIASDELLRRQVNNINKKLKLYVMTPEEWHREMEKQVKAAKKTIDLSLKEGLI